jgi:hypothetical protein
MKRDIRLLFGPLSAAIFAVGIIYLARAIPKYSYVSQTVSEIGEVGSPVRIPFAILLCCIATCIAVFAWGVRAQAMAVGDSQIVSYLIGFMAFSCAGVGIFAFPHPLHNVFGISELIGYQAPLALALTWRRHPRARFLVRMSWILYVIICVAIALNLSSMNTGGVVWAHVKPFYGLAQRTLFGVWFGWCAIIGFWLYRRN